MNLGAYDLYANEGVGVSEWSMKMITYKIKGCGSIKEKGCIGASKVT